MFVTKSGIKIPEKDDPVYGLENAIMELLTIIQQMARELDRLSDEIDELKEKSNN